MDSFTDYVARKVPRISVTLHRDRTGFTKIGPVTLGAAGGPDSHGTANLQANSLNLRAALVARLPTSQTGVAQGPL